MGESENYGLTRGAATGLGLQNLGRDLGEELPLVVKSDSSTAIGVAQRRGPGKIKNA